MVQMSSHVNFDPKNGGKQIENDEKVARKRHFFIIFCLFSSVFDGAQLPLWNRRVCDPKYFGGKWLE